jgi:hypothetical protein
VRRLRIEPGRETVPANEPEAPPSNAVFAARNEVRLAVRDSVLPPDGAVAEREIMLGRDIVEATPEEAVDVDSRAARRACMCRAAAVREDSWDWSTFCVD